MPQVVERGSVGSMVSAHRCSRLLQEDWWMVGAGLVSLAVTQFKVAPKKNKVGYYRSSAVISKWPLSARNGESLGSAL